MVNHFKVLDLNKTKNITAPTTRKQKSKVLSQAQIDTRLNDTKFKNNTAT